MMLGRSIVIAIAISIMMAQKALCATSLVKARTIGELVLTLLAGGGTAFTSPVVVPAIYQSYGTDAYSIESLINNDILTLQNGGTKAEAIEAIGTGTPYNLDVQEFRDLVYTNWEIMSNNNIDTVLRFDNIANTDSVYGAIDNLGQIVKNVAQNGYLSLENTIAIVTNPGTTVKVALGNVWDIVKRVYRPQIASGVDQFTRQYALTTEYLNASASRFIQSLDENNNVYHPSYALYSYEEGDFVVIEYQTGKYQAWFFKKTNWSDTFNATYTRLRYDKNHTDYTQDTIRNLPLSWNYGLYSTFINVPYSDYVNIYNRDQKNVYDAWKNGNVRTPYAPYIINQEVGNVTEESNVNPAITNDEIINIIPKPDYENYIQDVNDTTTPQEAGEVTDGFINNYIDDKPIPQITTIPPQPTIIPKPTITPEDTEETMQLTTTPGLSEVFPFCLPWDIVRIFKVFQAPRKAPYFKWDFNSTRFGNLGTIELDLELFDEVATVFRMLVLIGYIILLAVGTRRLIGA